MRTHGSRRSGVSLTILGSGDAFVLEGRRHASTLVTVEDTPIVVDFGPTTMHGLHAAGVDPRQVRCVLATHFHGDHVLGLPMLLLDHQYRGGPRGGLVAIGPPGLDRVVLGVYGLVYAESAARLARLSPPLVRWRPIRAGSSVRLPSGIGTVRAVAMDHSPESLGYRIEVRGRTLAFSGDTRWCPGLVELARGADVLVVECTFPDEPLGAHLGLRELADRRAELEAERIVLTHLSRSPRARVPGFLRARDGMTLEL